MKNNLIVSMVREGVLSLTSISLPKTEEGDRAAYSVYKFKKAIEKAFVAVQEAEKELFKEAGIEDPNEFNKEQQELSKVENPTTEQMEALEQMKQKAVKYNGLASQLYNEEANVECSPISWGMWRLLLEENKSLAPFEGALEGVLWKMEE